MPPWDPQKQQGTSAVRVLLTKVHAREVKGRPKANSWKQDEVISLNKGTAI